MGEFVGAQRGSRWAPRGPTIAAWSVGRRFQIAVVEGDDRFGCTLDRAFQFGLLAIVDPELELYGIDAVGVVAAVSGHGITAVEAMTT